MSDELPEDAAHVVVLAQQQYVAGNNPNEIRIPLSRLPEEARDGVETEPMRNGGEQAVFRAGDEIPLENARGGTYSAFSDMLAVFDDDGNRLDPAGRRDLGNEGVQKWRAQ